MKAQVSVDGLKPFEDPDNPGNGEKYHTGKPCITAGCESPAGTAWSPYWCFACNVKRIKRIDGELNDILESFKGKE